MANDKYPPSQYNKDTGYLYCGCCQRDGLVSVYLPTCTGCANKLRNGTDDSPQSVEYIQAYCDYWNAELAKMSKE